MQRLYPSQPCPWLRSNGAGVQTLGPGVVDRRLRYHANNKVMALWYSNRGCLSHHATESTW